MVVDFELKKFSLGNLTKFFFQSSLGFILLNGGLAEECVPAKSFYRKRFLIWLFYEKSISVVVDFELKTFPLGNLTKSFFPI